MCSSQSANILNVYLNGYKPLRNLRKDDVLKKTITYTDFNDEEVSEDFFFHLSKAELVELEMSHKGGLSESLKRIVAAEDGKAIIAEFKSILLGAYGKKSEDGRRFIKNQQLRDEFESSEAYSVLFMELVTDTAKAIEFINGIIPKGMGEEAAKLAGTNENEGQTLKEMGSEARLSEVPKPEPKIITKVDLDKMSGEEVAALGSRIQSGEVVLGD